MNPPSILFSIAKACTSIGGQLYIVGGSVRDSLLGISPKDWDIEIHRVEVEQFISILEQFGISQRVGKSFGVWKLNAGGIEIDISMPMINKNIQPNIGIEEALRRRDLCINAIAYDLTENKYIDPFKGRSDIENRRLRYTDKDSFAEDPLRAFRVAQFAARFEFTPTNDLIQLCNQLPMDSIAVERISVELEKLFLKPRKPSIGLEILQQLNLFQRCLQEWEYSPKILPMIDRAVYSRTETMPWNLGLMWAVATHHLSEDKLLSLLERLQVHTLMGFKLRKAILDGNQNWSLLQKRCNDTDLRKLAEAGEIYQMASISQAIKPSIPQLNLKRARALGISRKPIPYLIQGRDLQVRGYKGKEIGMKLKAIRLLQLEGKIQTREPAISALNSL